VEECLPATLPRGRPELFGHRHSYFHL
jgi:hypothetical protein